MRLLASRSRVQCRRQREAPGRTDRARIPGTTWSIFPLSSSVSFNPNSTPFRATSCRALSIRGTFGPPTRATAPRRCCSRPVSPPVSTCRKCAFANCAAAGTVSRAAPVFARHTAARRITMRKWVSSCPTRVRSRCRLPRTFHTCHCQLSESMLQALRARTSLPMSGSAPPINDSSSMCTTARARRRAWTAIATL